MKFVMEEKGNKNKIEFTDMNSLLDYLKANRANEEDINDIFQNICSDCPQDDIMTVYNDNHKFIGFLEIITDYNYYYLTRETYYYHEDDDYESEERYIKSKYDLDYLCYHIPIEPYGDFGNPDLHVKEELLTKPGIYSRMTKTYDTGREMSSSHIIIFKNNRDKIISWDVEWEVI